MEFRKHIKDIRKATIKAGDMYTHYERVSPTKFKQSYSTDDNEVIICDKCGDFIYPGEERDHKECTYGYVDEYYVAETIVNLLEENENNIVCINEGFDDQCFIQLYGIE